MAELTAREDGVGGPVGGVEGGREPVGVGASQEGGRAPGLGVRPGGVADAVLPAEVAELGDGHGQPHVAEVRFERRRPAPPALRPPERSDKRERQEVEAWGAGDEVFDRPPVERERRGVRVEPVERDARAPPGRAEPVVEGGRCGAHLRLGEQVG